MSYLDRDQRLAQFVAWASLHITGDEKGEAQTFIERLMIAFGQKGARDVGGTFEYRVKKGPEDGGGTSFADYVWKPTVLIEMKKRGADLSKHYRQAFDYWVRPVPDGLQYSAPFSFDGCRAHSSNAETELPSGPPDRVPN